MAELPVPKQEQIIFEDKNLYACLANYPIAKGHVVAVWKRDVSDLHLLKRKDYEHLMDVVDEVRNAMLAALKIEKVYLIYMDETQHVHWHLVPRYNEKGLNVLEEKPKKLKEFGLAEKIKAKLELL
ncbi:HIT domain-containing protein [Candidatus Woesearchaeota archaeon]|nr:HIT domain-containing protein [Candidatus Woesearchaeota archaeon]